MVDRYLLRYFLAVVDSGSFSKGARQLNVAQPTLSVGIGKLERLLGATLFDRSSQRIHLTDAGVRLSVHARRIEQEFNAAESAVIGMKPSRSLRLGVISTFPNSELSAIVKSLQQTAHPERLEIVAGDERELLHRLTRGRIDVALTLVRPDDEKFSHEVLFEEGYSLAMARNHALAQRDSVSAEELADNPMIVRRHCEALSEISRHFTERGVRPFFAFRGMNDDQILALVQAGLGVTVMPACYRATGVARPELQGFELKRAVGLIFATHADEMQQTHSPTLDHIRVRLRA